MPIRLPAALAACLLVAVSFARAEEPRAARGPATAADRAAAWERHRALASDSVLQGLAEAPGLFLAGSAVGAFGIPDCVASGERAAGAAIDHAARVTAGRLRAHP